MVDQEVQVSLERGEYEKIADILKGSRTQYLLPPHDLPPVSHASNIYHSLVDIAFKSSTRI
jgi:hypothetical protein